MKEWAEAEFGADNLVALDLHTDESTPHVHVLVTPIKAGKLQAKQWLDGPASLTQIRARAHRYVNATIPCEYTAGSRTGGKPHDPGKAAGAAPVPSLLDQLGNLVKLKSLLAENAQLKARVHQLEQVQFSRKKTAYKAAQLAEADKRAQEAAEMTAEASRRLQEASSALELAQTP